MSRERSRTLLIPRREFLCLAAAAGVGSLSTGFVRGNEPGAAAGSTAPSAAELIPGKDPRLLVHNASTLEIETPLELLRAHRVTPKQILFVRNNQTLAGSATVEASATDEDWTVELTGLVEYPRQISVKQLRSLPQVEREIVLQCSGNGRSFFSRAAKVKGAPWSRGAMGNVRVRGVTLQHVIESLAPNIGPAAKFVCAEGRDAAASNEAADFEHSLPLADALARSILALELNGEPIPAVHGGPVRLVTPGYYGTMHIKWLGRLRFEADETFNHHQLRRYRTPYEPIAPGSEFTYGRENSEPNWRMRLKTVIFAPLEGQSLPAGKVASSGVAFNDGASAIESVLVSTDGGSNWRSAELEAPAGPYGWYHWQSKLDLAAGDAEIIVRAVDTLGRSQPLDANVQWNPAGYGYSAADRVRIALT